MNFRTEYKVEPIEGLLSISRPVMLVGSCFSDNILRKMRTSLWKACNPGGALYNPLSIVTALRMLLFGDSADFGSTLRQAPSGSDGIWHSMMFDTSMSARSKSDCMRKFEERKREALEFMDCGSDIIATFGTMWAYFPDDGLLKMEYHPSASLPVGNCHKFPASMFSRRLLGVDEVTRAWMALAEDIRERWPQTHMLFTVSPIRHLKDGMEGNSLSKALLRVGVDSLVKGLDSSGYFPAFEILTDDLRDYRFYARDMVHPSEEAIDYIWECFISTYLGEDERRLLKRGEDISKALGHKPLMPETPEEYSDRMRRIDARYAALRGEWPESLRCSCL